MLRRNLSRSARLGYISVSKAVAFITDIIYRWIRGKTIVGDEVKLFKDGVDTLNKALDVMTSNIDTKILIKILEEGKSSKIEIVNSKDSVPNSSLINNDALNTLIEKALYWCDPCDVKDYKVCAIRGVFEDLGVPPYNQDSKDRCLYCYSIKPGRKPIINSSEFIEYCNKHYDINPEKDFIEAFEDLLAFNVFYYDKNGVSEKILRKFIEFYRERM
jgi:hypothetical protein